MWPDRRLLDLFGIEHPIILAPMGGAMDWELTTAVAEAGGLGSLPCMMWTPGKCAKRWEKFARVPRRRSILAFSRTSSRIPTMHVKRRGAIG